MWIACSHLFVLIFSEKYGLKQSQKDSFIVTTTLASTKLTQNTGLLQLLKYGSEHGVRMDPNKLRGTLMTFNKNITAQEFAKFMQDVLDALFNILMENENEAYDNQVFRTIVDTILLITDDRSKLFSFFFFSSVHDSANLKQHIQLKCSRVRNKRWDPLIHFCLFFHRLFT